MKKLFYILFIFVSPLTASHQKNDFLEQTAFSGTNAKSARKNIKKYIVEDKSVFKDFEYQDMHALANAFAYRWDMSYILVVCHFQERGYFDKKNIEEPKKWYDLVDRYKKNLRKFENALENRDLVEFRALVQQGIIFEMEICNALRKSKDLENDYTFLIQAGVDRESLAIILENLSWSKAITKGNIQNVRELIAQGYSLNKASYFTRPPLIVAIGCENTEIIGMLLAAGANVNLKLPGSHETPVMMAVADWADTFTQKKIRQVIEMLIENGAYIDEKDVTGRTALMKAMEVNNKIAFETLLRLGADPKIKNNKGYTVKDQILKITKKYGTNSSASRNEYLEILKKYKKR